MSFQDALAATAGAKRHVLLGNGFSIACDPARFSYGRLFDEADFSNLAVDRGALFALAGTSDFERVIEMLRMSASVVELYESEDEALVATIRADADRVKNALADVLAQKHPDHVHEIDSEKYEAARIFLSHFSGHIYTVNYDLLLYWTLIQNELAPEIACDDGFRADPDDPGADCVVWDPYASYNQRVYFLHGGLHLYDSGAQLVKLTFARTGVHLVEQIRDALSAGSYPLVVTEGASEEKLRTILHSAYLARGLRSLTACGGALFVYGHSLAENDAHILRCISDGKVKALYVSIYGDPSSDENEQIRLRAEAVAASRRQKKPLQVAFFAADTAAIWA
jgi:hypothetical protein